MKRCYTPRKFSSGSLALIGQANDIIEEYAAQGFDLTLLTLFMGGLHLDRLALNMDQIGDRLALRRLRRKIRRGVMGTGRPRTYYGEPHQRSNRAVHRP